jgi:hypothetical protein
MFPADETTEIDHASMIADSRSGPEEHVAGQPIADTRSSARRSLDDAQ